MSHNVEYYQYPLNVSKEKVKNDLDNYVAHADWQEGCAGLYHPIRWLDGKIYNSLQEARDAIDQLDRGCYDNLAVQYIRSDYKPDDTHKALSKKADEARSEYESRDLDFYPRTISSAFIGCKKCGSKLARTLLRSNSCPVCGHDLRPEYILKSVESALNKWKRARDKAEEYARKHSKKEVIWLVKIEYHT